MTSRPAGWFLCVAALLASCGSPSGTPESAEKITVAAAANLTDVFAQVGSAFKAQRGIDVVFSFGATAELAQQIENGAQKCSTGAGEINARLATNIISEKST